MNRLLDLALDALLTDPVTGAPLSQTALGQMGRGLAIAITAFFVITGLMMGLGR